jgi:GNAT superfamily N-acetyltransferase
MPRPLLIRPARTEDHAGLWRILEPVIRAGETYALPRNMSERDVIAYWTGPDRQAFVAEDGSQLVGTYYLRANQLGGGSHVANCGYVTAAEAVGRGVARAMCAHSIEEARRGGFTAMQFNLVVAANERAVRLWSSLGFATVGRLPQAFLHPRLGYVDALVMYRAI